MSEVTRLIDLPSWMEQGTCASIHQDDVIKIFFARREEHRYSYKYPELAKYICLTMCPVQPICLDYAIKTNQPLDIWGGLTEHDRRQYKQKGSAVLVHIRQKAQAETPASLKDVRFEDVRGSEETEDEVGVRGRAGLQDPCLRSSLRITRQDNGSSLRTQSVRLVRSEGGHEDPRSRAQ